MLKINHSKKKKKRRQIKDLPENSVQLEGHLGFYQDEPAVPIPHKKVRSKEEVKTWKAGIGNRAKIKIRTAEGKFNYNKEN